ncbi:MAG: hypothetical protein J6C39_04750 [Clostridia bacterium]|nr:hypothetical protein [Clostridia bacterium]MBO5205987.1 hypothetical protein [Clostridia bacterium]MBP3583509.1 hypothetical protein [Clostridia bacterium]
MSEQNNRFEYKYSALSSEERLEIESIRRRYLKDSSGEGRTQELKRLDFYVRSFPVAIAITVGVIGILLFGLGLTLVLELNKTVLGIILGTVGVLVLAPANLIYNRLTAFQKKKYGQRILDISEELLGKDGDDEKVN